MKRYFAIYGCLLRLNFHRALIHKADFTNGMISSLLWGGFSVLTMYILTARSSSVFGWSRAELFVLVGVFNILIGGLYRTLFSRNFDRFSQVIQRGDLDGLLLKPINPQFALSFWYTSYHGFVRVVLSVLFTLYALSLAHVSLTLISGVSFLFLGVFSLMTLYAFWFIIMTFAIWFPDLYNLVELLYATDNISRYPPQLLWTIRLFVFVFLFPITLIVSVPAKALLHTITVMDFFILISCGLILLYSSHLLWKFALRYYTSASG